MLLSINPLIAKEEDLMVHERRGKRVDNVGREGLAEIDPAHFRADPPGQTFEGEVFCARI